MKKAILSTLAAIAFVFSLNAQETIEVKTIWDRNYSAFTSIAEFGGRYYISFREGQGHVFDKNGIAAGQVRILMSEDGEDWKPVALLSKEGYDLRDPKLSVTPDGRLMVTIGGSFYRNKVLEHRTPHVSFSSDGVSFSDPEPIYIDGSDYKDTWLWRVTWHNGLGYGVCYDDSKLTLVKTADGMHYDSMQDFVFPEFPNETTVRFDDYGRMYMMVRRDKGSCTGLWGVSNPPYTEWDWTDTGIRVGGPDFIFMPDSSVILGSRRYEPEGAYMTLFKGDQFGHFTPALTLPSGGDTSYPGMIIVGDELWVVYYSSAELGRGAIYFTKLHIPEL